MSARVNCMVISQGRVYVTVAVERPGNSYVLVMDTEGTELDKWKTGGREIFGIAIYREVVFVSHYDGLLALRIMDGSKLYALCGPKPDQTFDPAYMTISLPLNKLYVTDCSDGSNAFIYAFALSDSQSHHPSQPTLQFEIAQSQVSGLALVGDTELFAGRTGDSGYMYDAKDGTILRTFMGLPGSLFGVTTSAFGELCFLSYSGEVRCQNPDATVISHFRPNTGALRLRDVAWHEDKLFGIDVSGTLHVFTVASGKRRKRKTSQNSHNSHTSNPEPRKQRL